MKKFNNLFLAMNSPWKAALEIEMYMLKPIALIYLRLVKGVKISSGYKFYGLPKVLKAKESLVTVGKKFENRNWWFSNPLGINHPTIICAWKKDAQIVIGDDVGISGGSIVASEKITIGDGTLIGANCMIIDTDFHPIKSAKRRYDKNNIKTSPVTIGKNVFIGTGCIILKGSIIPDNTVVPAGSVIRKGSY